MQEKTIFRKNLYTGKKILILLFLDSKKKDMITMNL
jgi:hypothetical protein